MRRASLRRRTYARFVAVFVDFSLNGNGLSLLHLFGMTGVVPRSSRNVRSLSQSYALSASSFCAEAVWRQAACNDAVINIPPSAGTLSACFAVCERVDFGRAAPRLMPSACPFFTVRCTVGFMRLSHAVLVVCADDGRQLQEHLLPYAFLRPYQETVVNCRCRPVLRRQSATATALHDMNDALMIGDILTARARCLRLGI